MSTHSIAPVASPTHIWDAVSRPPASALKQIRGGRLTGMTDVNPQWRYRAMTEVFGPCGQGWKYEIARTWTEQGTEGQILAFCEVHLWWRDDIGAEWEGPIPGIGGSMLVAKETGGLRTNDEGFKMATTDALSVAMKMLGVAADIYAGLWDGSKYKEDAGQPQVQMPRRLSEAKASADGDIEPKITEADRRYLEKLRNDNGHDRDDVKRWLARRGFQSSKDITVSAFGAIRDRLSDPSPLGD